MSVKIAGKEFQVPNALAAIVLAVGALGMSVGVGGCTNANGGPSQFVRLVSSMNEDSYGQNNADSNRQDIHLPSVRDGGMSGKTIGGGGVNTPKVKGVNESAGINNAGQKAVGDLNKKINEHNPGNGGR